MNGSWHPMTAKKQKQKQKQTNKQQQQQQKRLIQFEKRSFCGYTVQTGPRGLHMNKVNVKLYIRKRAKGVVC